MSILHDLLAEPPVLVDGAMGTMLIARGLPAGRCGEVFTLERPEVVAEIHRANAGAGAVVLTTNTFGANPIRLRQCGLLERMEEFNLLAVQIARKAAGPGCAVAGSIGPTGAMFDPGGTLTHEQAAECFAAQAALLDCAGADCFLIETMYDLREALAAIDGCRRASNRPVLATMTFTESPQGFFTIMGDECAEALTELRRAGADAVGANCTLGSAAMLRLAGLLRKGLTGPLLIQPNAGQPHSDGFEITYPESPPEFAENLRQIAAMGVELVGGCCGTTPEHIAAAHAALTAAR